MKHTAHKSALWKSDYILPKSGSHTVNEMHQLIDAEVDYPNHQRRDDGSNHHDNGTIGQFTLSRPGNLMNELVIRFLDIRKPVIKKLFHLFICLSVCTGSKARTHDLRFWRPSLYQLSYSRIKKGLTGVQPDLFIVVVSGPPGGPLTVDDYSYCED